MLGEDGDDLLAGLDVGVGQPELGEVRVAPDEVGRWVLELVEQVRPARPRRAGGAGSRRPRPRRARRRGAPRQPGTSSSGCCAGSSRHSWRRTLASMADALGRGWPSPCPLARHRRTIDGSGWSASTTRGARGVLMGIGDRLGKVRPRKHGDDASDGQALDVARYAFLLRVAPRTRSARRTAKPSPRSRRSSRRPCSYVSTTTCRTDSRPPTAEPADLAQAAFSAQLLDHGHLVRILRRPGQGVTEGHAVGSGAAEGGALLYAHSLLASVAAAVAVSPAVTEWLAGFPNSPRGRAGRPFALRPQSRRRHLRLDARPAHRRRRRLSVGGGASNLSCGERLEVLVQLGHAVLFAQLLGCGPDA